MNMIRVRLARDCAAPVGAGSLVRVKEVHLSESMNSGLHEMAPEKLVRVQEKGQVTIPAEIRRELGLKQGDLVAVTATPDGVLITPRSVVTSKALDRIGELLREQGLSLDDLVESGRQVRGEIAGRE